METFHVQKQTRSKAVTDAAVEQFFQRYLPYEIDMMRRLYPEHPRQAAIRHPDRCWPLPPFVGRDRALPRLPLRRGCHHLSGYFFLRRDLLVVDFLREAAALDLSIRKLSRFFPCFS